MVSRSFYSEQFKRCYLQEDFLSETRAKKTLPRENYYVAANLATLSSLDGSPPRDRKIARRG